MTIDTIEELRDSQTSGSLAQIRLWPWSDLIVVRFDRPEKRASVRLVCGRVRQEMLVLHDEHWYQIEIERLERLGKRRLLQVAKTVPDGEGRLRVKRSIFEGALEIRRTRTDIDLGRGVRWDTTDQHETTVSEGYLAAPSNAPNRTAAGELYIPPLSGEKTVILPGEGKGQQLDTKTSFSDGHQTVSWTLKDLNTGKVVGKGQVTTPDGSNKNDTTTKISIENKGADGSTQHISGSKNADGTGSTRSSLVDANNNVTSESRSETGKDANGNLVTVTSTIDYINGTITEQTDITSPDGNVYTHTIVTDFNGKHISEEEHGTPPSSDGQGDNPGDEEGDNPGDEEGDNSGNEEGDNSDEEVGDNSGEEEGDSASSDPDDGDGLNDSGPAIPGGVLAKILSSLHGLHEVGEDETGAGDYGRELTPEQVARIMGAAHAGGGTSTGGGETTSDGVGDGSRVIVLTIPPELIDDNWEDHPRPDTIQAISNWALNRGLQHVSASLSLVSSALERARQTLT